MSGGFSFLKKSTIDKNKFLTNNILNQSQKAKHQGFRQPQNRQIAGNKNQ